MSSEMVDMLSYDDAVLSTDSAFLASLIKKPRQQRRARPVEPAFPSKTAHDVRVSGVSAICTRIDEQFILSSIREG